MTGGEVPCGTYPRIRPSVLRQQAAALNIMAALVGQGHMPDQADLRMAAMNCYAAADDLEDCKR